MIDFTPAPAAASPMRQIVMHAGIEARLLIRNGEQLLLALAIPLGVLIGGRFLGPRFGWSFESLVPSVFAMAIWSTCFTALAVATGFERRYGVLERLSATSLGRGGLLGGKALAMMLITAGQLVILAASALALGWRPTGLPLTAVFTAPLAMVAFAALALAMAGTLRAEATLGLANLIYLVGLGVGVVTPLRVFPEAAHVPLSFLPTMALGESLRGTGGWLTVVVLALWAVLGALLARKVFKWIG